MRNRDLGRLVNAMASGHPVGLVHQQIKREQRMEKYGVEIDPQPKTKTAADGKETCSRCGNKLDENRLCPVHGSEPLERNPHGRREVKEDAD